MKNQGVLAAIAALALSGAVASAQDDNRFLIEVDEATQALLLADMRGLTESLDKLMAALAEGNFEQAARIGEIDLGFGHAKLQAMVEGGATDEQIDTMRARMKANREARAAAGDTGPGPGMGALFGIPVGVGQKMPDDFRMMGQTMHASAEDMANAARAVGETPTAADYQTILQGVQGITGTCVACHTTYRVR
ncbi:MAG: hypothetical protein L3J30_04225 [Marinosulfonomonas sp.]|nr:hypothetical protein [Marinosulfonomonas sp.]